MSKIGKKPVALPANVQASVEGRTVKVKGPKGELSQTLVEEVKVSKTADGIVVEPVDDSQRARAMWGMQRTLVDNMVQGVTTGYTKVLEISGVGFKAELKGKALTLKLGYSHDCVYDVPAGVTVVVSGQRQDQLTISGIDKQMVGEAAAKVRAFRKPEPYQGKGVKYRGEYILRKEGKKK